MSKPKVSVVCITYNHEEYIEQALEGFVSQKVNFEIEVLIGDDCSADNTPNIIKRYADKYPNIIKPILRKKNIGIAPNLYDLMRMARGKYIALCEGDDYWTDDKKLQIQADFLDKNPNYSICFHPTRVIFEDDPQKSQIFPDTEDKEFTIKHLLKANFIQTNSVMYRRKEYNELPKNILPIDWYLHIYHSLDGNIHKIDKTMGVYRRHSGGIWQSRHKNMPDFWEKYSEPHVEFFIEANKLTEKNKSKNNELYKPLSATLVDIYLTDKKNNGKLFSKVLENNQASSSFIAGALIEYLGYKDRVSEKKLLDFENKRNNEMKNISNLYKENQKLKTQIISKEDELRNVINSNSFKVGKIIMKLPHYPKVALINLKNSAKRNNTE